MEKAKKIEKEMSRETRDYREKKKIFAIVNSIECSCEAPQLLLLLVLAEKKNVFMYFNDSRVYRERKKNLVQFPINSSCVALQLLLLLCWLEIFFYLCILMIKMGL